MGIHQSRLKFSSAAPRTITWLYVQPVRNRDESSKTVKGKLITNYDLISKQSRNNIVKKVYLLKRSMNHLSIGALSFEKCIYQSYGKIGCKDSAQAHF